MAVDGYLNYNRSRTLSLEHTDLDVTMASSADLGEADDPMNNQHAQALHHFQAGMTQELDRVHGELAAANNRMLQFEERVKQLQGLLVSIIVALLLWILYH